jgi:hypothetical protein
MHASIKDLTNEWKKKIEKEKKQKFQLDLNMKFELTAAFFKRLSWNTDESAPLCCNVSCKTKPNKQ